LKLSVVPEFSPACAKALTGVNESETMLHELLWENAFINVDAANTYRFHDLFREFLLRTLENFDKVLAVKQFNKAGDWFFEQKDYYRAVEYYLKGKNDKGVSKGLSLMYDYNSSYTSIENTLSIIRLSVDGSIVEKHPFLMEVQAWTAFVEGHAEELEYTLDKYYKALPKIILRNPMSAVTNVLLRFMDYRNSLVELVKKLSKLPFKRVFNVPTPSVTQNMPLFHRSMRDFTEFSTNTETSLALTGKSIGVIFGAEFSVMENCITAGLLYEKGDLNAAHGYAIKACASLRGVFSPELKFCALMVLANVYMGQGLMTDHRQLLVQTAEMIEKDKAYYLNANFEAYRFRCKLSDGDREAAKQWLEQCKYNHTESVAFYQLYCHFTTARALICMGDYNAALLLLQKLLTLCEEYRRPLDCIEANILLAVAHWKKGQRYQKDAMGILECAMLQAQQTGYTQLFAAEGAELVNMLQKWRLRTTNDDEPLTSAFVKTLYLAALAQSKRNKGLTGGRVSPRLKFTKQQMIVMKHLCDGHSYKGIAEIMGLKYTGIKSHMQLICRKLDVSDSVAAVLKIKELGILE
jgi:LuxR family maltose regulon positive regulatory protein